MVGLFERSGAVERIEQWEREDRKSAAGRMPLVPPLAVLVAFMMSAFWSKSHSFDEAAETITSRITPEQLRRLDITRAPETGDWYQPFWRAARRLQRLIDPWHQTGLDHKLNGAASTRAQEQYGHEREQRGHDLAALIVRASNDMLPKRYLEHYSGDVALDSTAFKVQGPRNHFNHDKIMQHGKRNGDYQCGLYVRDEVDHDGTQTTKTRNLFPRI